MPAPDLGGYTRPPVVEVVAAVGFMDLPLTVSAGLGEFWRDRLSSELPDVAAQPPYPVPMEKFDGRRTFPEFTLEMTNVPPLPRYWFSAASGDELVQLQANWLACNWRKIMPESQYGRWNSRREAFARWYEQLTTWVSVREARIIPTQCEVTYINHIFPIEGLWHDHADAYNVFAGLKSFATPPGIRSEQEIWQGEYLIDHEDAVLGRLHVKVQPGFSRKDDLPIFVMELTARGAPREQSAEGVMRFLDLGREAVVLMFEAATTTAAHEAWGKE